MGDRWFEKNKIVFSFLVFDEKKNRKKCKIEIYWMRKIVRFLFLVMIW